MELFYAVIFELILLAHAMVIRNQLRDIPNMALYTTEHLITVSLGMTVVAAMSTLAAFIYGRLVSAEP